MFTKGVICIIGVALRSSQELNLPAVFIANGLGTCLMLVLLLSRHKHARFASLDGKLFLHMCALSMTLCILETVCFLLDGKQFAGARSVIAISNSMLFILFSMFACVWVCYVDYKLFGSIARLRRIYPFVLLPAMLICALGILNMFTDVYFYLDADNRYVRKPLCLLPFAVSLIYMAYGAVLSFRYRKQRDKYVFMTVIVYMVPVYLGVILQYFYYGISLIWVATSFGVTSLFINLQHEVYYIDSLTGLYNRRYLYDHMEHLKARKRRKPWLHVSGIIMDINNFKNINDTYGHLEGDDVLRKIGKLLLSTLGNSGIAVRYGGDEFMVIMNDASPEKCQMFCTRINQRLEYINRHDKLPYNISLAMGVAELDGSDTDEFFRDMDRHMYENKRLF